MNKNRILANTIFIIHLILVLIILFGWYFPSIRYIYLGSLIVTLISELFFGYCPLTKWEFYIRKKIEPVLDYDFSFLSYYAYKMGIKINKQVIRYTALIFLSGSIIAFYARV